MFIQRVMKVNENDVMETRYPESQRGIFGEGFRRKNTVPKFHLEKGSVSPSWSLPVPKTRCFTYLRVCLAAIHGQGGTRTRGWSYKCSQQKGRDDDHCFIKI